MAKTVKPSKRDQDAAAEALTVLESATINHRLSMGGEQLRDSMRKLVPLLKKVARPRVSRPLRVH